MDPFTTRFNFTDSCPWCGRPIDAASDFKSDHRPKPGDAAVCIRCGKPAVYTISLRLRKPEPGELEAHPEQFKTVCEYAGIVEMINTLEARKNMPRVRNRPRARRR